MNISTPASPPLSSSQLAALATIGEERSAPVGELLYRVGDRTYPFVAILEGEVAIIDAVGNELIKHGPSGFLRTPVYRVARRHHRPGRTATLPGPR